MYTSNLTPSSLFSSPLSSIPTILPKTTVHPLTKIRLKPRNSVVQRPVSFTSNSTPLTNGSCISSVSFPAISVAEKVNCLASEFKSLTEPIDRVKRLLFYATLLPPFEDSARIEENRVVGCTAQVWLEVEMVNPGLMRFRADSDSEITKGFISCLIWLLDGAVPEEVLAVDIDDLFDMNVGLPSRGNSRVNTWHNVLISMQKRTRELMEERDRKRCLEEGLSSLVVWPDSVGVCGSCKEAQASLPRNRGQNIF